MKNATWEPCGQWPGLCPLPDCCSALSQGSEFVVIGLFPGWLGEKRDTRLVFWYIMNMLE